MVDASLAKHLVEEARSSGFRGRALRRYAMELLDALPNYHWSGIYRLESDALHLDEYVGAATDHTRIEVGVGVCGTAVAQNANQLVDDVRQLSNYLACSTQTRSEIVVLIRRMNDSILGQIDIDSHVEAAFDSSDERMLEHLADLLAERWADEE